MDSPTTDRPSGDRAAHSPPHPAWRLLALAWHYRAACVRVFAFQVVLLALGLGGLGLSGVAIDVVRHALVPAGLRAPCPLGLAPPASWPADRLLLLAGGAVLAMAALRAVLL